MSGCKNDSPNTCQITSQQCHNFTDINATSLVTNPANQPTNQPTNQPIHPSIHLSIHPSDKNSPTTLIHAAQHIQTVTNRKWEQQYITELKFSSLKVEISAQNFTVYK